MEENKCVNCHIIKKGKWFNPEKEEWMKSWIVCPFCEYYTLKAYKNIFNYCPSCGADLRDE